MRERMTIQQALDTIAESFNNVAVLFDSHTEKREALEKRVTALEEKHDCPTTNNSVFILDARPAEGACPADKAVADLALDLAYIDPHIKSCDQARVRVGFELRLWGDNDKEEILEAVKKTLDRLSDRNRYRRLDGVKYF